MGVPRCKDDEIFGKCGHGSSDSSLQKGWDMSESRPEDKKGQCSAIARVDSLMIRCDAKGTRFMVPSNVALSAENRRISLPVLF